MYFSLQLGKSIADLPMKNFAGNPDILNYGIPAVAKCNWVLQKSECLSFMTPNMRRWMQEWEVYVGMQKKEDMGK